MTIHLVSFGNTQWIASNMDSKARLLSSAMLNGVNHVHIYDETNIPLDTTRLNPNSVGYGYYAWKPIIILDVINKIPDGDLVLYHDIGRLAYRYEIKKNLLPFAKKIKEIHHGVGITYGPWINKEWCKRKCFECMDCDNEYFWNSHQIAASWNMWEKTELSIKILTEWKEWCFNQNNIISDENIDMSKEYSGFVWHRWDQSILTNIIRKYERDNAVSPIKYNGMWEKDINNYILVK